MKNSVQNILLVTIGFLAFSAVSLPAAAKSDRQRVKEQIEVGLNLQPEAAQSILNRGQWASESREDYYVDLYDGADFLLYSSPSAHKLRLKDDGKRGLYQAKSLLQSLTVACPGFPDFAVKRKVVGELKVNRDEADSFIRLHRLNQNLLRGTPSNWVPAEMKQLQKEIRDLPLPRLELFLTLARTKPSRFVVSHEARKTKWWSQAHAGPYEVSVTRSEESLGGHKVQDKYELEFQISDPSPSSPLDGKDVCEFLQKSGLTPADLTPERVSPQAESLRLWRRWNSALGL